jgi:hypothetical protein
MTDLYTVQLSMQQRIGEDGTVRVWAVDGGLTSDARREEFVFTFIQADEPEDLRDWLRRSLAAVVESI